MHTEPLYRKVGRRYVPTQGAWSDDWRDGMNVGTFRLTYCYSAGGRRFEYDVTPDTAGFVAAAVIARLAIEDAIRDAVPATPMPARVPYTAKQLAVVAQARKLFADNGMMFPEWWQNIGPHELAEKAIKAVREYRP